MVPSCMELTQSRLLPVPSATHLMASSATRVVMPVRVEKFCSSLDIMPTLANLFALPYDSRLVMGRDILSDAPGRVIFADYSFLTDAGAYDASQDLYTAWDGQEADPEDVRAILDEIGEQFTYSALILDNDYYRHVLPDGVPAPPEEPGGTAE